MATAEFKISEGYHAAAICTRGHVATDAVDLSPDFAGKFCKECGNEVITTCPSCQKNIRGYYHVRTSIPSADLYKPPNFCEDCGKPFPWMIEKLQAASALADELEVTDAERAKIKQSLDDIARDTPATSLAVIRLKKWFGTAKDAVGQAIWKASVEIATEAAKKSLLGP